MSDKYSIDNFITAEDGKIDFALFPFKDFKFSSFSVFMLTSVYEQAPDLVSFDYYGTYSLYWLLLYVNGFSRAEDFKTGAVIKIPSLQEINQFILTINKGYNK
jgi:hypothetical protein